jgi:hypothetical protein
MRLRTTIVLLALFFAGLGVLWYADYAAIPTAEQRREIANRLIPELIDTPIEDVQRIEVDRKAESQPEDKDKGKERSKRAGQDTGTRVVVSRREGGGWQLVEPVDAAADPNLVETLIRNLKDLRKSPEAGTIRGAPGPYGLDTPRAVVRVFGRDGKAPLATLDVGRTVQERIYVRPSEGPGIEVVDARLIHPVTLPAVDWRDRSLFRLPSFRVAALAIDEAEPRREVVVQRDERRWRMTRPVQTAADDDKAEGLVAELAALGVAEGPDGFVADDVRDFAPYGLDKPAMTITMTPFAAANAAGSKPQVLKLGKPVPDKDKPNQVYAVRGDQDDVVRLDVKTLREAYQGPNSLRSQKVADFTPARVYRVVVEADGQVFDLARSAEGWELLRPSREAADNASVQSLLNRLTELKTSEFFDPERVSDARLDPPRVRLRVWQTEPGAAPPVPTASEAEPEGEPRVDLRLGRHDVIRKAVFGQVKGDTKVLILPDSFLTVLPRNGFAYRDLTVQTFGPAQVSRLTVERADSSVTIQAAGSGSASTSWRMVEPVSAAADQESVTRLVLTLSNLRAEGWESATVGDGKAFGLDAPRLRVKWTLEPPAAAPGGPGAKVKAAPKPKVEAPPRVLRLGKPKAPVGPFFANIESDPRVFSLSGTAVESLEAELHDRSVLKFPPEKVERVVYRWPTRTLALSRPPGGSAPSAATAWKPEPGYDPSGFDPTRTGALVAALSDLKTPRFLQYSGPIPDAFGLSPPRLTIQVWTAGEPAPKVLRVGGVLNESQAYATSATGLEGPVFILPTGPAWDDLMRTPPRAGDLPVDVFQKGPEPAPAPKPATPPR